MSDLPRNLIQFSQACLPPLPPGEYKLRVEQTIQEIRPQKPFRSELDFSVAGPRFDLNPADIYSVYPPANQSGEFGSTLPQIVFNRRTVPWERTMDGSQPDNQNPCPWLALIVVSASDFNTGKLPEINARQVAELISPADNDNCTGPALETADLADYEKTPAANAAGSKDYKAAHNLCNTIDMPADLFKRVAPQLADLPYLAHVRTVQTENKETLSYLTEGSFAVVLANRMPQAGTDRAIKNAVYLVSLEGFQNYLTQPDGSQKITTANVRLAVLAHWEFYCFGRNSFKVLMGKLATGRLQRPVGQQLKDKMADDEGAKQVGTAFELGYTALNHHLRNGEKTVSWYRGPLIPMFYPKKETYPFLPSADKALRYNYNTGMLDASYAAAWQLGRLLALQNQQFAQALYRYRNRARLETKRAIEDADLYRAFHQPDAGQPDEGVKVLNLEDEAIKALDPEALKDEPGQG